MQHVAQPDDVFNTRAPSVEAYFRDQSVFCFALCAQFAQ